MRKREKIILGGYELWVEAKDKYNRCLVIYDTDKSKHGIIADVMGTGKNIYISALNLTDVEKKELSNHLLKTVIY